MDIPGKISTGGALGCDGDILLQAAQASLLLLMSLTISGQQTDFSALAIMRDVPWWAQCSKPKMSFLSDLGITILSLYKTIPL